MNVVVDTSVAVAWYIQESFSEQARKWQARILSGNLHAMVPPIHYCEFANVLRTYIRRKEMDVSLASELYAVHLDAPLDVVEPPRADLLDIANAYQTTACDAAFIALALAQDASLLTAERTSTPWVVKLGKRAIIVG